MRIGVKGFAIGRTILVDVARAWFAGGTTDQAATNHMTEGFAALTQSWTRVRRQHVARSGEKRRDERCQRRSD